MLKSIAPYRKAIVAAVVAGLTALYAALQDDMVTAAEWTFVAIATLGGGGTTYVVPNTPAPSTARHIDDL
ncbi:UNVERIFIED_CONTAM: hypothetical protein RF653_09975 [Kocuria sp. CPCC 205316]|uniref:hypothetical protein n=1 Tax=Kocuria TaxID=57493 RepID=UPI0036DB3EBE